MPFADELLGAPVAASLTGAISAVAPDLPLTALHAAPASFADLGLRERSDLLRDALLDDLGGDYLSFTRAVRDAAHDTGIFTGWLIWPVTSAVVEKALADGTEAAFDDALDLLAELTPRLTAEFAIRGLLAWDLDRALVRILGWTSSPDEHVRRLASEGTRPFLPWSKRVPEILSRPESTIPVLDALYRDESEYVRRSVANHLNDLSRQQSALVIATATRWLDAPDDSTLRLVRHALRSLIKQGHPEALALMGFAPATVTVDGPLVGVASVAFDGAVEFRATVTNDGAAPVKLAIDYVVEHQKAGGKSTSKTFKLVTSTLAPGERVVLAREHSFRPLTTRRYYPGTHAIELQVNGVRFGRAEFELEAAGATDTGGIT